MHKLIAIITNHPSPLEESVLEGKKVLEFFVDDPRDPEQILRVLEPKVMTLRGDTQAALSLVVKTESGNVILSGEVKNGFHGVWIS